MLLARANRFPVPGLLLAALLGCVRVEQTLTLDADGGGALSVQYGMPLEAVAELEARMKAEAGSDEGADDGTGAAAPSLFSFDEEQVRADFRELEPQGIALQEIRSWESDGFKHLRILLRFRSLEALAQTEFLSDRQISLRRVSDTDYEFRQAAPPADPALAGAEELMGGMLAGFRAELSVEVPGPIVNANADTNGERRATWVFDLEHDPRALSRAQHMDLRIIFNGAGLSLAEFPAR